MRPIQRVALIGIAVAAYLIGFWPTWWIRDFVLGAFGNPPYQGVWILIPHLFLYGTLQALLCLVAWNVLARRQWMPALRLSPRMPTFGWGFGVGLLSVAIVVRAPGLEGPSLGDVLGGSTGVVVVPLLVLAGLFLLAGALDRGPEPHPGLPADEPLTKV